MLDKGNKSLPLLGGQASSGSSAGHLSLSIAEQAASRSCPGHAQMRVIEFESKSGIDRATLVELCFFAVFLLHLGIAANNGPAHLFLALTWGWIFICWLATPPGQPVTLSAPLRRPGTKKPPEGG